MFQYKGFVGQIEYDSANDRIMGEVINAPDVILFEGTNCEQLNENFRAAIDEYLAFAREIQTEPVRPFVGRFTVCLAPEQQMAVMARAHESSQTVSFWLSARVNALLNDNAH